MIKHGSHRMVRFSLINPLFYAISYQLFVATLIESDAKSTIYISNFN